MKKRKPYVSMLKFTFFCSLTITSNSSYWNHEINIIDTNNYNILSMQQQINRMYCSILHLRIKTIKIGSIN